LVWFVIAGSLMVVVLTVFFLVGAAIPRQARSRFDQQRERLQADFLVAASSTGKPRGLIWKALDWTGSGEKIANPTLARDRDTGEIVALVPVTISFEAIVGGDMEGLPAVGNLRNASAVFFYRRGQWHTSGKTVFNLNPDEALIHFKDQYSPLTPGVPRATGIR
jgi:hypothetical protein